jgi:hypothetical protein
MFDVFETITNLRESIEMLDHFILYLWNAISMTGFVMSFRIPVTLTIPEKL